MISKEQILENFQKFTQKLEANEIDASELIFKLGVSFMETPYSATNKFYGAFAGGYIDHVMRIGNFMYKSNKMLPEAMQVPTRSIVLVAFFHGIASAVSFVPNPSKWHVTNLGQVYTFDDSLVSMTFAERSIKMLVDNGIKLTDEEYQAILNYNKEDDKQSKYFSSTLAQLLKVGIILANEEVKPLLNA